MTIDSQKIDRISIVAIVIITVFIIFGGAFQMRYQLFAYDRGLEPVREKLRKLAQTQADAYLSKDEDGENLAALQEKDTDGDGLNDFEELYVHATSPYLADSDSDSQDDPTELAAGTNPNCPEGQACSSSASSTVTSTTTAEAAFANLNPSELGVDAETGEVDMAQLRQQLREYGVPEDVLQKTDDETLKQLFTETLAQTAGVSGTNTVALIQDEAQAILDLPLAEKRQMLVQAGLDSATVDGLDEETVNTLFEQAVGQAVTQVTEQAPQATQPEESENPSSESDSEDSSY